jgi:hypothetical protein
MIIKLMISERSRLEGDLFMISNVSVMKGTEDGMRKWGRS